MPRTQPVRERLDHGRLWNAFLFESQPFFIANPERLRLGWCQIYWGPGSSTPAALAREVAVEI